MVVNRTKGLPYCQSVFPTRLYADRQVSWEQTNRFGRLNRGSFARQARRTRRRLCPHLNADSKGPPCVIGFAAEDLRRLIRCIGRNEKERAIRISAEAGAAKGDMLETKGGET